MQLSLIDLLPNDSLKESLIPIKSNEWYWHLKDYPQKKNGLKVFSCFACGGGSTMGYKLAGCDVLGCVEIDKRVNKVYVKNHQPKYNYLEDLREFNKRNDLPQELYELDILDGSPPCTPFSLSGDREESWGNLKKYREGQKTQVLDELPFVFIETVDKLKPKVVIMENVLGLMQGNAWDYAFKIYERFNSIGYSVRIVTLKAEKMGVPQMRYRVFFIATRLDFNLHLIDFNYNYVPITYGEIRRGKGRELTPKMLEVLNEVKPGEMKMLWAWNRLYNKCKPLKATYFNYVILYPYKVLPTITTNHGNMFDYEEKTLLSDESTINASTFPQDFDFMGVSVGYICGMSVPPLMMKRLVERIIKAGIFNEV